MAGITPDEGENQVAQVIYKGVTRTPNLLLGIWEGTPICRFSTGILFGAMLATLLVPGISQFIVELSHLRFYSRGLETQGGNK